MANPSTILKTIKDKEVKFVDLRFTDPRGKWQHVTFDPVDGRRGVPHCRHDVRRLLHRRLEGDQRIRHDADARSATRRSSIRSSPRRRWPSPATSLEPSTGERYGRCPRSIAKAAEQYLVASGVGDTAYFGPEAEFFIFDDVRFDTQMNKGFYFLESMEGPYNSGTEYEMGNLGHRPAVKGGYFPVPPVDSCPGHPQRDARHHGRSRHGSGKAPPRSGRRPA